MRIKKITSQRRRDFRAIYECGHCGHEQAGRGYDDAYFHKYVIPEIQCGNCGQTESEEYRPLTTKYPDDMTV